MKKTMIIVGMIVLFSAQFVYAEDLNPKVQGIFGYALPMPNLSNAVNGSVYFGGSLGVNTPCLSPLSELELSFTTATFTGKTDTAKKMTVSPLLLSGIFNINISVPDITPFVKIGGGIVFESSNFTGADLTQNDAGFLGGIGASYEVIPKFNIKLEVSYLFIYQRWFSEATENASLINIGLGLNYKF